MLFARSLVEVCLEGWFEAQNQCGLVKEFVLGRKRPLGLACNRIRNHLERPFTSDKYEASSSALCRRHHNFPRPSAPCLSTIFFSNSLRPSPEHLQHYFFVHVSSAYSEVCHESSLVSGRWEVWVYTPPSMFKFSSTQIWLSTLLLNEKDTLLLLVILVVRSLSESVAS